MENEFSHLIDQILTSGVTCTFSCLVLLAQLLTQFPDLLFDIVFLNLCFYPPCFNNIIYLIKMLTIDLYIIFIAGLNSFLKKKKKFKSKVQSSNWCHCIPAQYLMCLTMFEVLNDWQCNLDPFNVCVFLLCFYFFHVHRKLQIHLSSVTLSQPQPTRA